MKRFYILGNGNPEKSIYILGNESFLLLVYKNIEIFLLCWIFFQLLEIFYYLEVHYYLFNYIANVFPICHIFFKNLFIFYHKMEGLISLLSLYPMKYLEFFLTRVNLLHTIISLMFILFIKIELSYWWFWNYSISVSSNFIIFYPFLYVVLTFLSFL